MQRIHRHDELWTRYGEDASDRNRNALIEEYLPLVHRQAHLLRRRIRPCVTYDEMCSAGYDGLVQAVEAYKPALGVRFETFCQKRIRGAILDWLRQMDPRSRTLRNFCRRLARVQGVLAAEHDGSVNVDELVGQMGLSTTKFDRMSRLARSTDVVSFSSIEHDQMCSDLADTKPSHPYARLEREMLLDRIDREVTCEERRILKLYYLEGLTLREIGSLLGLSESRMSQIHTMLLARLRTRLAGECEGWAA